MYKKILLVILFFISVISLITFVLFLSHKSSAPSEEVIAFKERMSAELKGEVSDSGQLVKEKLIKGIQKSGGTIISTPDFEIGYAAFPLDQFDIYIDGINVEEIENNALSWLKSRGFSEADLCGLPVIFFVVDPNAITSHEYKLKIGYLPDFCSP